jgi:SAM-dependent methyltransferase
MKLDEIRVAARADVEYHGRTAREYFDRHEQPIQRYTTRIEARWLRELVAPGSRVLVAGSGGGRELPPLLAKGCTVVALDYSQEMLEVGRRRWAGQPVEWVLGDVHDLSRFAGSFDYVITLAALNYFVDIDLATASMREALVPGGTLIASSINANHPSEKGAKPAGKVHRFLYAPGQLAEIATRAGLTVREVRGFRYWVDNLPPKWNQPGAGAVQRAAVALALVLERAAGWLRGADRAKFFWIIAERSP